MRAFFALLWFVGVLAFGRRTKRREKEKGREDPPLWIGSKR